ncbi:MAG: DUF5711 family protein [Oscillospiraceae bacterium]|nr:DUF5711 family protein [Oscillospiraceae bacterium]
MIPITKKNKFLLKPNKKTNKSRSIIKIFFLLLVFIILALYLFISRSLFHNLNILDLFKDTFCSFGPGDGFPISTNGFINTVNFGISGRTALVLSNTEFSYISPKSKIISKINHNFSNPLMISSGKRTLIFDCGGIDFKIVTKSRVIINDKTEQKITAAAISPCGVFGFITESDEYNCEMLIIDQNNKKKYKYYFSKLHVSDIAISTNGCSAIICGFCVENNEIKSIIQILNFKSKTPEFTHEVLNNPIISVNYFSNGNAVLVGEKSLIFINKNKNIKEFSYDSKQLCFASVNNEIGIAISVSPMNDERDQQILILSKNGKKILFIETNKKLKSLVFSDNYISVLSENKALIYNLNGNLNFQKKVPIATKKIAAFSGSKAFVLGEGEVDLLS